MKTLLFLTLGTALTAAAAPPNVLFIAVDDLRPELGCYGATHMHTPNIDSLASQGRMFRNHYVQVPTCGASRYALMSGLRPTTATDDNNAFVNFMPTSLPANPESRVDLLRRNGWHTASLGKVTHEPDGYDWNFPVNYDSGRSSATFPDMRFSWNEIIYDHDKWGAQRYPLFAYADGTGRASSSWAYEIGVDGSGASLPDEAYPDGQMAQAATENLTGLGFSNREMVYSVVASTLSDDLTQVPTTSANLNQWSFAPLSFLDATDLGGGRSLFRYRLTTPADPTHFFRMETSSASSSTE